MSDRRWRKSHIENPPTLASVNARWCTRYARMILTDTGEVTTIGFSVCDGEDQ